MGWRGVDPGRFVGNEVEKTGNYFFESEALVTYTDLQAIKGGGTAKSS